MKLNKKGFMDPLPYEVYEQLKDFREAYDAILSYHSKYIMPELQVKGMDIVQVCHLLCRCMSDDSFSVYKKYAVQAPEAKEIIKNFYLNGGLKAGDTFIDPLDLHALLPLDDYIEAPVAHLRKYDKTIHNMLSVVLHEINDTRAQTELTKMLAKTSIQIEIFRRCIDETFKIHRKGSLVFKVKDLGIVQFSELVFMEFTGNTTPKHRVFIMETAVVAMRIKRDGDSENYESFLWSLPFGVVKYKNSTRVPERIKIYSKKTKYQKQAITFKTNDRKREFLRRLDSILQRLSGFASFI